MLKLLDSGDDSPFKAHNIVYRILLPITSLGFVLGSVMRQMKSFFFSGLIGIASSIHSFTINYFEEYFSWPIFLISIGIIWMLASWQIPRWREGLFLKRKE
jgi:hypothetical protein